MRISDWSSDVCSSDLAIVLGTRDYCRKNGFDKVWLGLSGGIDSSVVQAVAADALGADNVTAVRMPSRYTAGLSNDLAREQCDALGVRLLALPVQKPFQGFLDAPAAMVEGRRPAHPEADRQTRNPRQR